jgi:putative membrane protein
MSRIPFLRRFNWRALLMRFLVNFLALLLTVGLIPHVAFKGSNRPLTWVIVATGLGILNAFVKPVLQIVLLRFIFVSYGLVVVVINSLMLWLLSVLFPNRFEVDSWFWAIIAGIVLGLLTNGFENLLGLTPPILADVPPPLQPPLVDETADPLHFLRRSNADAEPRAWPPLGPTDDGPDRSTWPPLGPTDDEPHATREGAA